MFLAGCASPGVPRPPSLNLPEVVTDLTAARVGDEVRLSWTTPSRNTDKLGIKGEITAEICLETPAPAPPGAAKASGAKSSTGQASPGAVPKARRGTTSLPPCLPAARLSVTPGASVAVETLPAALSAAPARLVAYRIQLRNAAGRTAGPSAAVWVASGPAPGPVEGLHATATKAGAMLEWRPEASPAAGVTDTVELDRATVGLPGGEGTSASVGPKPAAEARFRAPGSAAPDGGHGNGSGGGAGDSGGTIDRSAQIGQTYLYTAERVRTVVLDGQSLEVRSAASGSVEVAMLDRFPPNPPVGLVASPGFAGDASAGPDQAQRPAIDLSWEPGTEARIAGYRVYRRELEGGSPGTALRLNSEPAPVPAYRDLTVAAGRRYAYRVTAVDGAGNESGPSGEVVETAPER
jgi:hypothetical protein